MTGAQTWISESSTPYGSEQRIEGGWCGGVRDVAGYPLHIANTAASAQRGRAASSSMLVSHLQQPVALPRWGRRWRLDVALSAVRAVRAVRTEERERYIERLEAFVDSTAPAWRSCCPPTGRAAGPPRTAGAR
ncbi:hypothetical protein ACFXPW_08565 [Streptomyces goshikiensis]|uniref:hypothetical protein n=1 Tax=Streptomyces goshikiensis TaxID=1942 RepID=UPI0036C0F3D9